MFLIKKKRRYLGDSFNHRHFIGIWKGIVFFTLFLIIVIDVGFKLKKSSLDFTKHAF